jgi:hypothetical protein
VVAHGYFTRKIETMAARLEVLLGLMISACERHFQVGEASGQPAAAPPSARPATSPLTQLPQ